MELVGRSSVRVRATPHTTRRPHHRHASEQTKVGAATSSSKKSGIPTNPTLVRRLLCNAQRRILLPARACAPPARLQHRQHCPQHRRHPPRLRRERFLSKYPPQTPRRWPDFSPLARALRSAIAFLRARRSHPLNQPPDSQQPWSNIQAGKAVSEIIRTTLGPRSMLKMLLDPMGGIVMTNDGNSILREVDVSHPAAKSMIELSRAQEEEVGDGTTSVIVLAGEYLARAEPLLERQIHPTVICNGYLKALDDAVKYLDELAMPLDLNNRDMLAKIVESCTGTKFVARFSNLMVDLALEAVQTVRPRTWAARRSTLSATQRSRRSRAATSTTAAC